MIDKISMSLRDFKVNGIIEMLSIKKTINNRNTTNAWVIVPANFRKTVIIITHIFLYIFTDSQK